MAVLATEKVLTLDYWKPAYKVAVGDYLFDRNGNPVMVTLVQEYQASSCYTVHLNDHLTISGDSKMEFLVETPKYRKRLQEYKGYFKFKRPLKPTALADLLDKDLRTKTDRLMYSIPTCDPIKLPTQYLPIPPFIFGYWFFNRLSENLYTEKDENLERLQTILADNGYKISKTGWSSKTTKRFSLTPSIESQLKPNVPYLIPNNYLLASEEQRLDLLRGIMAARSRQYSKAKDTFRFSNRNYNIFKQVQSLVESLGIKTTTIYYKNDNSYAMTFRTKHKLMEDQQEITKPIVHQARRYIRDIETIKPQSCVYIETDGPDGTFLVGEGYIACR